MAGAEDEAVTIEPLGICGIALEGFAEKDGTDFGAAEGEAEVAGGALVHGIHGETTGFVGGLSEEGFIHVERFRGNECQKQRQMRPSAGRFLTGAGVGFKVENWGESVIIAPCQNEN
jgi:hypothetical protein